MTILQNISLSEYTTFRTGGAARYFVSAGTKDELREAVQFARENNLPFFVLGGGSNTLASDEGFKGLVIKNGIKGVRWGKGSGDDEAEARAGAGENWDDFVAECVAKGFSGLENLSWIPGTVGAAPIQNIGAYGVEVKDNIESVDVLDTDDYKFKTLSNSDCRFDYRDSIFKKPEGSKYIVTEVAFRLCKNGPLHTDYKDIVDYALKNKIEKFTSPMLRQAVIDIRKNKLPDWSFLGTAGSFFKNPVVSSEKFRELKKRFPDLPGFPCNALETKVSLAWIIDKVCGLKGVREGDVGTYRNQALVIVNYGEATTNEVLSFAKKISDEVREKTGIEIEPEVRIV